jgi:hypothetical protein
MEDTCRFDTFDTVSKDIASYATVLVSVQA